MTPKEYLNKCRQLDSKVQELRAEYETLENTLIASTKYSPELPSPRVGKPTEETAIKLADRQKDIKQAIKELIDYKLKVTEQLDQMKNDTYRRVLRERYIAGKSFDRIALEMNYSIRRIYQLHGLALLEFGELFLKDCS